MPQRLEPADKNISLNGVIVELDTLTGKGISIRRVTIPYN
jgi:calcineurin-like phosphoesterase